MTMNLIFFLTIIQQGQVSSIEGKSVILFNKASFTLYNKFFSILIIFGPTQNNKLNKRKEINNEIKSFISLYPFKKLSFNIAINNK